MTILTGGHGKDSICIVGDLGWEDPLEGAWQPTVVSLPGESHGQKNLVGYGSQGDKKSNTTEAT